MHDKVTWPSQISSWSFWLSWLLNDVANATMLHCVAFKCSNDAKKKVWIYISTWYPMKIIQKLGSNGLCHQATLSCLQYIILIRAMIFGYSLWDEIYLKNGNKNSKRMLCQLFSCIVHRTSLPHSLTDIFPHGTWWKSRLRKKSDGRLRRPIRVHLRATWSPLVSLFGLQFTGGSWKKQKFKENAVPTIFMHSLQSVFKQV